VKKSKTAVKKRKMMERRLTIARTLMMLTIKMEMSKTTEVTTLLTPIVSQPTQSANV